MRTGIEGEHVTSLGSRPRDQPVKQLPPVAEGAASGVGYQVIDVQGAARREHVLDAKAADGAHRSGIVFQEGEGETLRLHGADARDEAGGAKMGTELLHDRKAAGDFNVGCGEADGGHSEEPPTFSEERPMSSAPAGLPEPGGARLAAGRAAPRLRWVV